MRFGRKKPSVLESLPQLGRIPTSSGPGTAAPPIGDLAAAYAQVAQSIDGSTVGKVFLVTGSAPGLGTTTVAVNVAIAAARSGRRVLLIDGDERRHGLSRFLSTGSTPGFTDIAVGAATMGAVARMVTIDDRTTFPVVPSGTPLSDQRPLSSLAAADAIETVAEKADIVLIDAPPVVWSDATPHLAVHADGSLLVVTDGADGDAIAAAAARLSEAGAPVVGYITNRAS
ncbi:MAG: AAA family ATPase [Acidimicrobiia bacterium]|nr:AAA family ATPase [Acidimicrobiia bacterium]